MQSGSWMDPAEIHKTIMETFHKVFKTETPEQIPGTRQENPVTQQHPPFAKENKTNGSAKLAFNCNTCNRSFKKKQVLQNHERTHTGEKPFECKECHKRFSRQHHLNKHMRLHTGEKCHSCSHCKRQFLHESNLRRHVSVHTTIGEQPYKVKFYS